MPNLQSPNSQFQSQFPSQLQIKKVLKIFPEGRKALAEVSLEIPRGDFVTVLGPSGCGKSTLLRLISGLELPTEGQIEFLPKSDGVRIAYVFQDAHLLPWRNVLSNVCLPLELKGVSRAARENAGTETLRQMGLDDSAKQYPSQLSGGMRMRASIARALVTDPELLLLDEPFSALDETIRNRLAENLRLLWQNKRMTVVFVTHSLTEAVFLSQRVVVLSKRPGHIVHQKQIALPDHRDAQVRSTAAFSHQVAELYQVFERERMLDE